MAKYIIPVYMSDDCTWSSTDYVAVECNSLEELHLAFMYTLVQYIDTGMIYNKVNICGSKFDIKWFVFKDHDGQIQTVDPTIYTLEDWFEDKKQVIWD